MKKISVIVTCHNLEKYLDECIDSIKQQIRKPDEIILVHDGCKEGAKAYTDVTTVFTDKNVGVAKARDMAYWISTGEKIVFFDGDDVMPMHYLAELEKVDTDIAYPNCVLWSGWGDSGEDNIWHEAPKSITLKQMLHHNEVIMPSMFTRGWYETVDGFDKDLPLFEDYDFWLKMLVKGAKFKKCNVFMQYRQRTLSRNHQSDSLKVEIYNKIVKKFTLHTQKPDKVTV